MSTEDQTHAAALHGEALCKPSAPSSTRSKPTSRRWRTGTTTHGRGGRDHGRSLVRFTGYTPGHELIAAGLLLMAGPVDGDALLRAVRTGYERQQTWM
jgi:hypothetical protein